ncbi:MAG: copper amine oxidase N-terminal domain-containing protein [Clostridiales bacterium]|jgi:hypothetical protein|nr:copper amine oxidase N-terminal domain-containing protein [Clostridiales bacterium]
MLLLSATKLASAVLIILSALAPASLQEWKDAYLKHLTSAKPKSAVLYDVDGNGTPELISDSAVYSVESGKLVKKSDLDFSSIALPADSNEKGIYVFKQLDPTLTGSITSVDKLDASFKLTQVGSIERDWTYRDYNTSKKLEDKRVILGKELSSSDLSPWDEPLQLRAITFASPDAVSHSISSLLDSYPENGGDPSFAYRVSGGYGEPGRGTYIEYYHNSFDAFPFQNLNVASLPETWLLMINGSIIPGADLRLSNGEPFLPLSLATEKLGIDRSKLAPNKLDGVEYVSASSVSKLGFKTETSDLFKGSNLKFLLIETGSIEKKYSQEYALGILQKELEARKTEQLPRTSNEAYESYKSLVIEPQPDFGRYYCFKISGNPVLFNPLTGEIFSGGGDYLGVGADGMNFSEQLSNSNPPLTNLANLNIKTNSEIKHSNGVVEALPSSYIGLFINGSLVENANVAMENDRCLVPIRLISENLGAQVGWDDKTRTVTIKDGDHTLSLVIGSLSPTLDGKEIKIDAAPKIIGGYTYVPLRFIAESLECEVGWSDGGASSRYLSGIRHAIVSRYPENAAPNSKDAALKITESELIYAHGTTYNMSQYQPLSEKPVNGSTQDNQRYFIGNMKITAENDRFYIIPITDKSELWVDKYTSQILVYQFGESHSFAEFYSHYPNGIDALKL